MNFLKCKKKKISLDTLSESDELPSFYDNLQIADLDKFFQEVYIYYSLGGYKCIKAQIILDIIIYLFTTHFLIFILFFFEWYQLYQFKYPLLSSSSFSSFNNTNNTNFITINEIFNNNNTNFSTINNDKTIIRNSILNIELSKYISMNILKNHFLLVIICYILLMYHFFQYLFSALTFLFRMKTIHRIFKKKMYLHNKDLESISFNDIMNLLINLQNKESYCRVKDNLTKYDIISRILRKDNYITALVSFDVLNFKLLGFNFMTNFIYHSLRVDFMKIIFPSNEVEINKLFYNKKIYKITILVQIFFQIINIPAEIIFRIAFFLFKNVDKFKSSESISKNRWSFNEVLLFKNYNELKHHFVKRISKSYLPTNKFLLCFKQKFLSIFTHFVRLFVGSLLLILCIVTFFIDVKVTQVTIFGQNFLTVMLIIGMVIGFSRTLGKDDEFLGGGGEGGLVGGFGDQLENYDEKNQNFKGIVKFIQNLPYDWERQKIYKNYKKIIGCYSNNIKCFIIELVSIIIQPILWLRLINNSNEIIAFIRTFSINLDGIGTVCSFSVPNFKLFRKLQEQTLDILKTSDKKKTFVIKFLNSVIYLEKYFCHDFSEQDNNNISDISNEDNSHIYSSQDIDKGSIPINEELSLIQENYYTKDASEVVTYGGLSDIKGLSSSISDYKKMSINDYIVESIQNNAKGKKLSSDEIKDNLSYYLNVGNENNFNEIINTLSSLKLSLVNV